MNTSPVSVNTTLVMLARVLERLERSTQPVDPEQFRSVVARVSAELASTPHDAGLDAVLDTFPSVAELYENLNYTHAGLCRSALDPALAAELAARAAIEAARRAA
ncbi:hypothetical protein [Ramlibacter sp.]|uniref:hypothetical protein n=1 Tax=Ramlibacter sp. TaxID=1917967 RepID=UPI002C4F58C3|nr:hypothetical protein [Ramlibacter sp.]HWI81288.1 hypothetical protein [Ramlibacter sp.]